MDNFVLINQKFISTNQAFISIGQRGFRFGDGLFETCKIVDGVIYDYKSHQDRICKGLKVLKIIFDVKDLQKQCYNLIKKNQIKNGSLRISISRGDGSIGYLPAKNITPLLVIETTKTDKNFSIKKSKITIGISKVKTAKKSLNLQYCKTAQGLNYILAKIDADKSKHFDDIMLNEKGYISECSSANIFWVKNGKIFTPSTKCDMLFGTIRKKLIEKFPIKINQVEARLSSILNADEIFLTNANILALAVDQLLVKKNKIQLKKDISSQVLQWLEMDIAKYVIAVKKKN